MILASDLTTSPEAARRERSHLTGQTVEGEVLILSLSCNGEPLIRDVCSLNDRLEMDVCLPPDLGASEGILRIERDDDGAILRFPIANCGAGRFTASLQASSLCQGEESGLFFYRMEFETVRGHCFFCKDPVRPFPVLRFEDREISSFQLTVTSPGYRTPEWARGGILYQVFVDRFCRGSERMEQYGVSVPRRKDALYNPDWENGVPQHAERPGGEVPNNEFFGGTLWGVAQKLPYLASLGVNILYLSPVFQAYSNHKYDTGDYERIDPGFGGDDALDDLIREAERFRIRIVLDGVFNHTGDDSRYFNRKGTYPDTGACQSRESPYFGWYRFQSYPDRYDCWWGVKTLPAIRSGSDSVREYFCGENGIIAHWMRKGIWGWRLDVADELADSFLFAVRSRVKSENPDALLWGEVWEDASFKVAYGKRRRYFRGKQLDSVMNYPFRKGILEYLRTGNCSGLSETVEVLLRHYPDGAVRMMMNLLGTHDTERILTALAGSEAGNRTNDELAEESLSEEEKRTGVQLLMTASLLQFTLPGIPCIYYGDEVGAEGYGDPLNRKPFPWGKENRDLQEWYRRLGRIRRGHPCFSDGIYRLITAGNGIFHFALTDSAEHLEICVNRGTETYSLPYGYRDLFSETEHACGGAVSPGSFLLLQKRGTAF
ncbi:MAG: glycoside hydrolase family 13 protein [Clostridia bacterium]|nr:glycoside hydrolase family 13 protein [Clostridia bacterium]